MIDLKALKHVHLIGVGGINMSAVAKILLAAGVQISGSDLVRNDQTDFLAARGAQIAISEMAENIPAECELVIYTSAAPDKNKERVAAKERGIPEMTNFAFLGQWFTDAKTIVVAGTHGKSTTTAMLGLILERAGLDPTVVVGSKVPGFVEGNLRLGRSDLFVVEGDEYARHFLEFQPDGLILNNLELDHTDVFPTIESLQDCFRELLQQVRSGGVVVANGTDLRVMELIASEQAGLEEKGVEILLFEASDVVLAVPGTFNALNAGAAAMMARALGAESSAVVSALQDFKGIWRRFEFLKERNGASIYSDYGHHPTAVAVTLQAAHDAFPDRRILLCFQPHHRNRTKHLFLEFIPSFDQADILVVCEIYDVAGRDASIDHDISSMDLVDALTRHDADRGVKRMVEYAASPTEAVQRILEASLPGDIVICMGAGDIDGAIRKAI